MDQDDFFKIIEVVFDRKLLQDGGLLIIEHSKHKDLSENKYLSFSKKYGGSMFSFYKATEEL
jgi:16S rRNA (guanine966-N2)-methyltransferase